MREIKFRVWNKELNRMIYIDTVHDILKYRDILIKVIIDDESIKDKVELMQYTEVQDKNGKEIYEGDIVHFYGGKWKLGMYEFDWTNIIDNYAIDTCDLIGALNEGLKLEIIGNIYDNPELKKKVEEFYLNYDNSDDLPF